MGDMSRCKHNQAIGFCDSCSPNWEINLITADAQDRFLERGIDIGKKECANEITTLRQQLALRDLEIVKLREALEYALSECKMLGREVRNNGMDYFYEEVFESELKLIATPATIWDAQIKSQ